MDPILLDATRESRSASRDDRASGMVLRPRLSLRKLLALPVVFGGVFALLDAFGSLTQEGLIYGGIAGTALSLAIILAKRSLQFVGILAGFGFGTMCGVLVGDPCTGFYFIIGPVAGWLVTRRFCRRSQSIHPTA